MWASPSVWTVLTLAFAVSGCAHTASQSQPPNGAKDSQLSQFDTNADGEIDADERRGIRERYYGSSGRRMTPVSGVERVDDRFVEETQYAAPDGRLIPAVISRPDGLGAFPVIVTIHGGQGGRDYGYLRTMAAPNNVSPTVAMFNEQPWVVVAISYRSGAFLGAEEDDVVAGIRFAKSLPGVNPERVCIMGGSHGGNLALRAAQLMGEEFRCVVAGSPWMPNPSVYLLQDPSTPPLSDLSVAARKLLLENREGILRGLRSRIDDAALKQLLDGHSIEGQAHLIKVPSLFLVSQSDEQVPHLLVEPTINRARAAGADVTTFTAKIVPHGFYWGRNQGGARITRGEKSAAELAEEAGARRTILEFLTKWLS